MKHPVTLTITSLLSMLLTTLEKSEEFAKLGGEVYAKA